MIADKLAVFSLRRGHFAWPQCIGLGVLVTGMSLMGAVPAAAGQSLARRTVDHSALAVRIVDALALLPGERVLLVGHPQFAEALVRPLRLEIVRRGGVDLGFIEVLAHPWPEGQDLATRSRERAALHEMFQRVDAAIMLPGATSDHPEYQAMYDVLASGHGRTIHLHWDANGSVGVVPGQPAPPAHEVDRVYERAILDVDLTELRRAQHAFIAALRSGEARVTTPDGTDLRFRIGDRPVNRQDGDASAARADTARMLVDREIELPAGAVRVAPVESSVVGVVAVPISWWAGREVRDLRLTFRRGRVVEVTARSGAEHVLRELDAGGDAARAFREFALGFNPVLAVPDPRHWIPYYGYGAGVVRLALGDNQELDGGVRGTYVRIILLRDASVSVGGRPWVLQGHLQVPN
ncbi:MAG TPA: aminopeptidase [Gemmatimonadales bacterium]